MKGREESILETARWFVEHLVEPVAENRGVVGTRPCTLEDCGGFRVGVRWQSGKLTWPCVRGCVLIDCHTLRIT